MNKKKGQDELNISHIDYKDVETLSKYVNPHGRIVSRKRTNLNAATQRRLAQAIKRSRFMGLMPFVER